MCARTTIKEWSHQERPREKMVIRGPRSLDNSELLAILIRSGGLNDTAVDVARKLLSRANNSLSVLSSFNLEQLTEIENIGPTKALSIMAAFELASRMVGEVREEQPQITSSSIVAKILSPVFNNLSHEECWVFYLNRSNKLIYKECISTGGISATVIDVRIIIKRAVEKLASSLIISHNHPSGNPFPGEHDKKQTRTLKEAATIFDISLLDHIIIAGDKYFSFADEGIL